MSYAILAAGLNMVEEESDALAASQREADLALSRSTEAMHKNYRAMVGCLGGAMRVSALLTSAEVPPFIPRSAQRHDAREMTPER